ncbi:fumarylacetoacetate hydrolase family protein [Beijerinckia indica]|uniref:5-carboxymethyl-2-hydroxymuconate Delta-isomerase n=1 Tax=Beijerinckia indica subsp. indica (strain ATCC 9039 / DSM 1715 / NCIMB 8712) TaxID=395963 RepID=B2IHU5_BEII9|nr:fumarylacetoacetate hydrolase family protein [Beijerinckia indica]ACB95988.1 5-carboxymethyl-2-hydroxymuconate Delta-isomerase [Beijerinckia indica subsp. indica ATCC 9039]
MPTRRSVLAAVPAGVAVMSSLNIANAAQTTDTGPHELPKGVTLLTIKQSDGTETLGVKTPSGILDVVKAGDILKLEAPRTLDKLLRTGRMNALDTLIKAANASPSAKPAFLDEFHITYGKLLAHPGKIVCVGLNYKAHARETGQPVPKVPVLFNKYNNSLAPHQGTIKLPPKDVSYKFDYETELLIVMGKTASNVSEADALNYVAGYAIGHDFSARDLQFDTGGQWMAGKTLDGFAPIGPYFVSADLVGDPNNLQLETRVNGEVRQSSNTNDFIFNTQQMIAYISKLFPLEPGDIIFTGTPQGVILGMPKDKQVWLKAGDKIESSIEKLGVLRFDLA